LELTLLKEGECSDFETWKVPKDLTNLGLRFLRNRTTTQLPIPF
jgi:hypothetical protein